jgi:hypothetical protein
MAVLTVRHGSGNPQCANKISVVKRKRRDPGFNQQQGNQQQRPYHQQQQPSSSEGQAQRKRGGKGKGKQQQQQHQHSHIANVASLVPPTTSTIALPGPSGIKKRVVYPTAPKERKPGPYKALDAVIDAAQASWSKPTIQMVKTLEQHITDAYLESPWAKVSHLSDLEESDVEMHPPKGKEGQEDDWTFEEADDDQTAGSTSQGEKEDPFFTPLSPSAEPLD